METHLSEVDVQVEDALADEAGPGSPSHARALHYPLAGRLPADGEAIEVAEGVLWARLAMPMALDHVNVWLLRDGEGFAVVDCGLDIAPSRDSWEALLAGPMQGRPLTRVICTHMHPDHIGLAGWLCARFRAPLLMSRTEYVTARMLLADTGRRAPEDAERFYVAAGYDEDQLQRFRERYGQFGMAVAPMPDSYQRLVEGDVVSIDAKCWRVVIGQGHSPEHVCLIRDEDGVMIAGDQILPRISSNVSVWPTEPLADPLGDWLASLARLRGELDEGLLVLPSHGEPFHGVAARLDALIRGHDLSLRRLERRLEQPRRAVDVFGALFARTVSGGLLAMATGEAIAHLNHLERAGRILRRRDQNGVDWWQVKGASAPPSDME